MDFITQLPVVGIEIIKNKQDQTDFIILLVLSVRDITVVCRLQHQNTPKKTHTEHVDGFFCQHKIQNTHNHSEQRHN